MRKSEKIESIDKMIPNKNVWYDYFDTIFISVMRKSNPYTRRLLIPNDDKKDNDLSDWHRKWQYEIIEQKYGKIIFGEKSFEKIIKIDGKEFRIDSVVKNIAIEFQHTLSVDIEEINSRFLGHKRFGFLPYLVIDYTEFSSVDFTLKYNIANETQFQKKITKWTNSQYGLSNNLFIDLNDKMIRISNEVENGFYEIDKQDFIDNILTLENSLILKKEDHNKKVNERNIIQDEIRNHAKEKERWYFQEDILINPDFKYFRYCFENEYINKFLKDYENEIFTYNSNSDNDNGIIEKYHDYYSTESNLIITYKTIGKIVKNQVQKFNNYKTESKYVYLGANIKIRLKNINIIEFDIKNGETIIIQKEKNIF